MYNKYRKWDRYIWEKLLCFIGREKNNSKTTRRIDVKHLNETNEISVFEGDIIRLALSDRGLEKADYQLLDEIVYMEIYHNEIHNEIMEQIIKKGVMIADKEYVFYSATTGQKKLSDDEYGKIMVLTSIQRELGDNTARKYWFGMKDLIVGLFWLFRLINK